MGRTEEGERKKEIRIDPRERRVREESKRGGRMSKEEEEVT